MSHFMICFVNRHPLDDVARFSERVAVDPRAQVVEPVLRRGRGGGALTFR